MNKQEATEQAEKIRLYWKALGYRVKADLFHDEELGWMVRTDMVCGWPADIGAPQKRRIFKDICESIALPTKPGKDRVVA